MSFTGNNNRIDGWSYDADGNLLNDSTNAYAYDAENRIATVNGKPAYIYDATGARVAKLTTSGTLNAIYILGPGGQITELNGTGAWQHSNVYTAGGKLLATYTAATNVYHYNLTDWLGTKRMQTSASGNQEETCTSLPFGDGLACTGSADATEQHFTGKDRDAESGLDYFGARYLSSTLGRFMTPDWAAKPAGVPYAEFGRPQSLNLYAYVGSNPISGVDPDGHCGSNAVVCASMGGGPIDLNGGSSCGGDCSGWGPAGPKGSVPTDLEDAEASWSAQQDEWFYANAAAALAQQQSQHDSTKSGPEDPSNLGHPLAQNSVVKKASDQAFETTYNGEARGGVAEAGFSIEYKDGKVSIANKTDSVHEDGTPNQLHIKTDQNTIAILHTHGNHARPTPSGGDLKSSVPNFVRSRSEVYVTVPGTNTYINLP